MSMVMESRFSTEAVRVCKKESPMPSAAQKNID
jgi:hypothetical protein